MPMSTSSVTAMLKRIMPHVEPHDPYTFMVQSRTNARRWYIVSIAANWGHGMCVCPDWEGRRNPALRRAGESAERHECWHIKQARRYWAIQTTLATAPDEALAEGTLDAPAEWTPPETPF